MQDGLEGDGGPKRNLSRETTNVEKKKKRLAAGSGEASGGPAHHSRQTHRLEKIKADRMPDGKMADQGGKG